jgi:hypothetical protein
MPINMPAELIIAGDLISAISLTEVPGPAHLCKVEAIRTVPNPVDGGDYITFTVAGGDILPAKTGRELHVSPVIDIDQQIRCRHGRALHGGFFGDEPQHDGAHCWPGEDPACDDETSKVHKRRQALVILARESTRQAA